MKITIVTVCWNAEKTIRNTIESVLKQKYSDFEYLIIDGVSTDNTYKIVCEYEEDFANKNIIYRHISEPDEGIFDAMNKAAILAEGEWINYMNADDKFHSDLVLEEITQMMTDDIDVLYGDTIRIKNQKQYFGKAKAADTIKESMPFCHQSSFVRTKLLREYPFVIKYRVADYNFFLTLRLAGKKFKQTDIIIADYSVEGYSNQEKYKTYISTVNIKHDHGLINKKSVKQKIKNIYFFVLLTDTCPFHSMINKIDSMIKKRKLL